jgi:SAM-dependent methyltransferase
VTADNLDWVPAEVDTRQANVARVYDYLLGGSHNFLADQDVARALAAVEPEIRAIAWANRRFLGRAVRYLSQNGIDQFLDIGSGIPTEGNVHEIAQAANAAARVVYADFDQVAIAHSRTILAANTGATIIEADLRAPEMILAHDQTRRFIDFTKPVGLLLVAVLHYVADADDPWGVLDRLRDALAPGSYLVICHGTADGRPEVAQAAEKVFNRSVATQSQARTRAEILRFFGDFELVEPGLVHMPLWRPDSPGDVPDDPARYLGLAGVARKPGPTAA